VVGVVVRSLLKLSTWQPRLWHTLAASHCTRGSSAVYAISTAGTRAASVKLAL
jgi:hypothetical protein